MAAEKGPILSPTPNQLLLQRSSPLLQWRLSAITALVFSLMVFVWSIDGFSIQTFAEPWRLSAYSIRVSFSPSPSPSPSPKPHLTEPHKKPTTGPRNLNAKEKTNLTPNSTRWIAAASGKNYTANLIKNWLAPGGSPCREAKTVDISLPAVDGIDTVELTAGEIHEFRFQALDESRNAVCIGGDYFETDLSGENWKSRPPVKDHGDGNYSMSLQVHPEFAGEFNLTVILLFRHYQGLKLSPARLGVDQKLRNIRLRFVKKLDVALPELRTCKRSDFTRDAWSGRWTRLGKNESCQISNDGRYRCLPADFPCREPWCEGALGALESNGWVYSSHCSFKMFSGDDAWDCLKNKWIFFWGDSNHVDSIRNMLNFVLGRPDIPAVPRRFDMKFSNPKNESETVRITSIFNGHWNDTQNYQGLDSLKDNGFRELLKKYFSEEDRVPDAMVVNSGLHDGIHWTSPRAFEKGAETAAAYWKGVFDGVKNRGLQPPEVVFRNTVATGGYARTLPFNPSKMEAFNGVFLEKMRDAGLVTSVVDNFDMTYPWHYDNRCNDGVHYGRAPAKMMWRDGEIGHQYFVDLMLVHVLLNALCVR
ncbi:Cytochrome P450 family protein [Hirschfeldia incana]|nr:Cytochrome P450 family protein [Hirschfeldia incana]